MKRTPLLFVLLGLVSLSAALQWPPLVSNAYPWSGLSQTPTKEQIRYFCLKPSGSESVRVASIVSSVDGNSTYVFFGSSLYALGSDLGQKWKWSSGLSAVARTATPVLANDAIVTVSTWDISDDKLNFFKGLSAATGAPLSQLPLPPYAAAAQLNGISLAADGSTIALTGSDGSVALFIPGRNWTRVREASGDFAPLPVSFAEKMSKMLFVWNNQIFTMSQGEITPSLFFTAQDGFIARGPAVPVMNGALIVTPFKENGIFSDPSVIAVSSETASVAWRATNGAGNLLAYYEGSNCIASINGKTASCLSVGDGSVTWKSSLPVPDTCKASHAAVDASGNLFIQMSADWGKVCPVAVVAVSYSTGSVLYSVPLPNGYNARDITINNRGVVVSLYSASDDTKLSCLMGMGIFKKK